VKAQPAQAQLASAATPSAPIVVAIPPDAPAAREIKPQQVASVSATIPPAPSRSVEKPMEKAVEIPLAQQSSLSISMPAIPIRGSAPILLTTQFTPYPYEVGGRS
jgi:hypothetical protein